VFWVRTDGQRVGNSPALQQQISIDKTICAGESQKANLSAGTNYLGGFAGGFEAVRRDQAAGEVTKGCMAEKGYLLVQADQAEQTSEAFAATQKDRPRPPNPTAPQH
jgi:hypothetical protein